MSVRFLSAWIRTGCLLSASALALGCASLQGARLYESGTEALDRGDSEQAIVELERAADLVPQASEVQNHLGLAYQAAGREREAEAAFRRAVDLDCENEAAVVNLRVAESRAHGVEP
jgi:Flp pilus assembly protein TadD